MADYIIAVFWYSLGDAAWYTLADYDWYSLAANTWYIIVRLLTASPPLSCARPIRAGSVAWQALPRSPGGESVAGGPLPPVTPRRLFATWRRLAGSLNQFTERDHGSAGWVGHTKYGWTVTRADDG